MPLYTYKCEFCGTEREENTPMGLRDCMVLWCGVGSGETRCSGNLKRKIDAPAAVYAPTAKGGLAT